MTKHSMTDHDILCLLREALNSGDYKQMAICQLAYGGQANLRAYAEGTHARKLLSTGATKKWARTVVSQVLIGRRRV